MSSAFVRGLQILELLVAKDDGLALNEIADSLSIPRSAAHRLLADLTEAGYVFQRQEMGSYFLGLKIVGLGQRHLASYDLVQLSQPVLKELADESGEMVRLAIRDDGVMFWVTKSQGAKHGLRYDPEAGAVVTLSCSATGIAWMSTLPEDEALQRIIRQGIGKRANFGPEAPQTIDEIRAWLTQARADGFAIANNTYTVGIASIAAPVRRDGETLAVISIAGPSVRLTNERLLEMKDPLLDAAKKISEIMATLPGHD